MYHIKDYEGYLQDVEIKKMLENKNHKLSEKPNFYTRTQDSKNFLSVIWFSGGWYISGAEFLSRKLVNLMLVLKGSIKSPDCLEQLFNVIGIDSRKCKTITNNSPRSQKEYDTLCSHIIGYVCDHNNFSPTDNTNNQIDIIRITPGDPLWLDTGKPEKITPFSYIALSKGKDVARSSVVRRINACNGRFYAISVGTHPDHRKKGLGSVVASASTSDIVNNGNLAGWSTEADNLGSMKIAQALGYQIVLCRITIPESVLS